MNTNLVFPALFLVVVGKMIAKFHEEFKFYPFETLNAMVGMDHSKQNFVVRVVLEIVRENSTEVSAIRADIFFEKDLFLPVSYQVESVGKTKNSDELHTLILYLGIFRVTLDELISTSNWSR